MTDKPKCSCTFEAGDSACDAHPTCPECGSILDGFWGRVAARATIESKAMQLERDAANQHADRLHVALVEALLGWENRIDTDDYPDGDAAKADRKRIAELFTTGNDTKAPSHGG